MNAVEDLKRQAGMLENPFPQVNTQVNTQVNPFPQEYDCQDNYSEIKKELEELRKYNTYLQEEIKKLSVFNKHKGKGKKAKQLKYSDEKLKEMYKSGVSITDLAKLCDVSRNTVAKRISGKIKSFKAL